MTRRLPATVAMLALLMMAAADYVAHPANPYQQPAVVALGSGASSSGGFCGSLPE